MQMTYFPRLTLLSSSSARMSALPVEPIGNLSTVEGEQALWRAVITQALMDAGSNSQKMEAKLERRRAIAWFRKKNRDFEAVCALAGFEVEYVLANARKAIAGGCKWRKA